MIEKSAASGPCLVKEDSEGENDERSEVGCENASERCRCWRAINVLRICVPGGVCGAEVR